MGGSKFQFTNYEFLKLINWKSLLVYLVIGLIGWLSTDLIPALQNEGGVAALIATGVGLLVNALRLWAQNNTNKTL